MVDRRSEFLEDTTAQKRAADEVSEDISINCNQDKVKDVDLSMEKGRDSKLEDVNVYAVEKNVTGDGYTVHCKLGLDQAAACQFDLALSRKDEMVDKDVEEEGGCGEMVGKASTGRKEDKVEDKAMFSWETDQEGIGFGNAESSETLTAYLSGSQGVELLMGDDQLKGGDEKSFFQGVGCHGRANDQSRAPQPAFRIKHPDLVVLEDAVASATYPGDQAVNKKSQSVPHDFPSVSKGLMLTIVLLLSGQCGASKLMQPTQNLSHPCIQQMDIEWNNECPHFTGMNDIGTKFENPWIELNRVCCDQFDTLHLKFHCQMEYIDGIQHTRIACMEPVLLGENETGRIQNYTTQHPYFQVLTNITDKRNGNDEVKYSYMFIHYPDIHDPVSETLPLTSTVAPTLLSSTSSATTEKSTIAPTSNPPSESGIPETPVVRNYVWFPFVSLSVVFVILVLGIGLRSPALRNKLSRFSARLCGRFGLLRNIQHAGENADANGGGAQEPLIV
jgi:hypothetical protein